MAIPVKEKQPRGPIEFPLATQQDLEQVDKEGNPLNDEEKEKAQRGFSRGDLCFVGLHAGQIVVCGWASCTEFEVIGEKSLELGPL